MTVILTWADGDRSVIECVESIRVVGHDERGLTRVEIKTFGNEPAINRVVGFTAEYGEWR